MSTTLIAPGAVGSRRRRRRAEIVALVLRRLAVAVPVVLLVSAGVFLLAALSPFDPLAAYLGVGYQRATQDRLDSLRGVLGLDLPWWRAWLDWCAHVLRGDLGTSRVFAQPVTTVIAQRLPWTLGLTCLALLLATLVGVGLGLVAGLRPRSWVDRGASALAILVQALPPYVLALAAVAVFALGLHWLPTGGAGAPGVAPTPAGLARHAVLPVATLALSQMPWLLLSVRASVRASLESDAVRSAVARGLPTSVVVRGHVLPASLAPLVTLLGARLPELIVGAVLIEEVFAWPGLAGALVASAQQLDFPLLAVLTVATTALVLLGSLASDAAYLLLDPRVSYDD